MRFYAIGSSTDDTIATALAVMAYTDLSPPERILERDRLSMGLSLADKKN